MHLPTHQIFNKYLIQQLYSSELYSKEITRQGTEKYFKHALFYCL